MAETLLSPSEVRLYGREITDVSINASSATVLGANSFLKGQLGAAGARFARIYAFSFEGQYYALPKPAIFLVHGDGVVASDEPGVASKDWDFLSDIKAWSYDKGDFSIRLDIETGPLERILLEEAIESGYAQQGSKVQLGGSKVQLGGSKVQLSGSKVHLRGSGGS